MAGPLMISRKDDGLVGAANRSDPLGVLAVWSARAREVVPHLTEQTTDVRGFQILVEAYRLWGEFSDKQPQHAERLGEFFMLVEQAFARTLGYPEGDWPLPGARRVRGRRDETPCISVSDGAWHLLGGQLANGIWGLYRGAARRAGLLNPDMVRLSETTKREVDDSSHFIGSALSHILELIDGALDGETVELPTDGRTALHGALLRTFREVPLRSHLQAMLIDSHDLNRVVANRLVRQEELDRRTFMEQAASELKNPALMRVIKCENLLAVLEGVFFHLCCARGEKLEKTAGALSVDLPAIEKARQAFADSGEYSGQTAALRQSRFQEVLDTSSPEGLARSVLSLHKAVSEERQRAPWVWEEAGRLHSDVDVFEPIEDDITVGIAWRNDYYLRPLRSIALQLKKLGG